MQDRGPTAQPKTIPATATVLVRNIWKNYFAIKENENKDQENRGEDLDDDEEINDRDFTETVAKIEENAETTQIDTQRMILEVERGEIRVISEPCDQKGPFSIFKNAQSTKGKPLKCGDIVMCLKSTAAFTLHRGSMSASTELKEDRLGRIQCFLKSRTTKKEYVQLQGIVRGEETVLGDAAAENELFLEDHWAIVFVHFSQSRLELCFGRELNKISLPLDAIRIVVQGSERERIDQDSKYFILKCIYRPTKGMFCSISDKELGSFHTVRFSLFCFHNFLQEDDFDNEKATIHPDGTFRIGKETYAIGDTVFFDPAMIRDKIVIPESTNTPSYISGKEHKAKR